MSFQLLNRKKRAALGTLVATLAMGFLSACGSSPSSVSPYGPGTIGTGGVPGVPGAGGCIPLSQTIGYQGINVTRDYARVYGGQVGVTAYGGTPSYQSGYGISNYNGQNYKGTAISMTMQLANSGQYGGTQYGGQYGGQYGYGGGYGYSSTYTVNVQGSIKLSPAELQDITLSMGSFGGGWGGLGSTYPNYGTSYPTTGGYGSQLCVSGIAFDLGAYSTMAQLYNGWVYLYFNGGQQLAYPITF